MDTSKEDQDIMTAEEIIAEVEKLIESEKSEGEPDEAADIRELEEALSHLRAFIKDEEGEKDNEPYKEESPAVEKTGMVNTDILTGPISGLKNFLIKKQRDNEAK
jgi:hypothetical protein